MANVIAVNRQHVYPHTTCLEVHECGKCGIIWGCPEDYLDARRRDGQTFYCPNGHGRVFRETDLDRERKRATQLERQLASSRDTADRWKQNAERERRSAIAYKGHLTRIRNRIANGVCPVPGCKRSGFTRVMAHIASQHPDWLHDHAHDLDEGTA